MNTPLVGIIMGSTSDWETMQPAADMLTQLGVPHEVRVVSAHRTPDLLFEYATTARDKGIEVIIAPTSAAARSPRDTVRCPATISNTRTSRMPPHSRAAARWP